MGTITRTFANNITTSGVFKPTAFNDASFDNVTAVPGGAVEGGNMVLLSTQTASASASISFTTGIDSTYKEYMFIHNNIHPSVDNSNFLFKEAQMVEVLMVLLRPHLVLEHFTMKLIVQQL
jgi:hypothetical protein